VIGPIMVATVLFFRLLVRVRPNPMSRHAISLKSRVRYEGRVRTFDRRATKGADLEKIPNPIWHTVGQVLRSKFRKPIPDEDARKPG
jgi:hypothetical protein